ncbi:MAG: 4-hydroxythreonine-4-phosphate dehydrogenase PdxA [Bacteroidota bacterium]|jgi:4-hydroxythreonine-4-phosphate dehydrogenase
MNEKPIIGITTGDLNGIGLEVIIKTLSDTRIVDRCTPVIFASNKVINYYRRIAADSPFTFNSIKDFTKINTKQINIFNCWEEEVAMQPGVLTDLGGKYAVRSLTVAAQCLKDGQVDALVTAPINKANTQSNDFPFTGHTPYLKNLFSANDALMILYKDNFRVALATEHIPIAEVAKHITKELINAKLQTLRQSLQKDFGIDKPKIAVLGMNPHAGDNGTIGKEEELILKPTIDTLFQQGHLVFGPYSADAFFARGSYQEFDAVLAMYHDQGLVAFKTIAQGEGVNYTAGLSKVRTSPDHGTAFDIAGKNEADPNSFREALFSAIDILQQREAYATHTANPLRKAKIEVERGVV